MPGERDLFNQNGMSLRRALAAEFGGTAALLAVVVGSGIMGERLAQGNAAIALLANSIATGAGLYVLIALLGPISGAHFNPVVTAVMWWRGERTGIASMGYVAAQVSGAVAGVWLAHLMFDMPLFQTGLKPRSGIGQCVSEAVATAGLLATILLALRHRPHAIPALVGSYITAAYWFTASTSFANPAVTIARSLTDTFAGIRPADVAGFIAAQGIGAILVVLVAMRAASDPSSSPPENSP
jgi:glycerol uptake facilitator-like aquaporin